MEEMKKQKSGGLVRLYRACGSSFSGFRDAIKYEEAFRQELALAALLIPLGAWLGESGVAKAMLCGSILLVLIVELINSALEAVVDRIGQEMHVLSGRAKDLGSAAVFLALSNAFLIWLLLLLF